MATGGAKVFGLTCQIALAWFLTKEDYAVYAIAISLSTLLSVLRDGGLQTVLVEKGRVFDDYAGPVFWMMLTLNTGTGLLIASIARPAAQLYHMPELAGVILLCAINIPLSALPAVLSVRLSVNMQFRELGIIQVVSAMLRCAAMLFFAWSGYGALSFLLPLVASNLTDAIMMWFASHYSPWTMSAGIRRWPELFRSGRWVLLGTFAIALGNNGAYFLLGKLLPGDVLGVYFFSYQIVMQLEMLLAENFYQILFASFVRMGRDVPRIRRAVPRALSVVVLVGAIVSMSIAAVFEPLEHALWHGKWSAAASTIYVLALVWPCAAGASVIRALQMGMGRFHEWGLVMFAGALASVGGAATGAVIGGSAPAASLGFGAGMLFGISLNARFALVGIGISATDVLASVIRPWLIVACAAILAHAAGRSVNNAWLAVVVTGVCFVGAGSLGLHLFAKQTFQLLLSSLQHILRGKSAARPPGFVESM